VRPWNERLEAVVPVRIALAEFELSKGHRRILRRNCDLEVRVGPATVDSVRSRLFHLHKQRFRQSPPSHLRQYLGARPGVSPCTTIEFAAYHEGNLIAASYLDLGQHGVSTQYGMFDPAFSERSLGTATMLWEIAHGRELGCAHYYMGYVFSTPSELDYKKNFRCVEWFDWRGQWRSLLDFPR
jgi:arginine-tRNA-protein transferase